MADIDWDALQREDASPLHRVWALAGKRAGGQVLASLEACKGTRGWLVG